MHQVTRDTRVITDTMETTMLCSVQLLSFCPEMATMLQIEFNCNYLCFITNHSIPTIYNSNLDILLLNTWCMQIYANEGIRSTQGQIENAWFGIDTTSS